MEYLRIAKEQGLNAPVSIQNNYSLITRSYETGMAEISLRENIPLLAYSPLGFGLLTEDFVNGKGRNGGRFALYDKAYPRYRTNVLESLMNEYKAIAHEHGMTLPQMAISFAASRPFIGSVIIGPSLPSHVHDSVKAVQTILSPEILAKIDAVHENFPNLCA
jgi:aryl-alcohol dehydrogenase-like predicted oxidoreductase